MAAGMTGLLGLTFTVGRWGAPVSVPAPVVRPPPSVGGGGLAPWPSSDRYVAFDVEYERLMAFRRWCASRKGKPGRKRRKVHAYNAGPRRATGRTGTTKVGVPDDVPEPPTPVVHNHFVVQQGVSVKWFFFGVAVGAILLWAYTRKPVRKSLGSGRRRKGRR